VTAAQEHIVAWLYRMNVPKLAIVDRCDGCRREQYIWCLKVAKDGRHLLCAECAWKDE